MASLLLLPVPAHAGSRTAQEKLVWMFTFILKCPNAGLKAVNARTLEQFIARERIDFTANSPEMLKIRNIGDRQRTALKGMNQAKIYPLERAKFGPNGTDIRDLFR